MINIFIPAIIITIIFYGLYKKIEVFDTFITGVKNGIDVCIKILPTLIGLITAVYMIRASGAIDILSNFLAPLTSALGIPKECTPLMLLKPLSGGGGLAIGSEILKTYGANSHIGLVSAVMLASSETSFYTLSIYFGSLGINKMKYTLIAVLIADFMAFFMSSVVVRLFF